MAITPIVFITVMVAVAMIGLVVDATGVQQQRAGQDEAKWVGKRGGRSSRWPSYS